MGLSRSIGVAVAVATTAACLSKPGPPTGGGDDDAPIDAVAADGPDVDGEVADGPVSPPDADPGICGQCTGNGTGLATLACLSPPVDWCGPGQADDVDPVALCACPHAEPRLYFLPSATVVFMSVVGSQEYLSMDGGACRYRTVECSQSDLCGTGSRALEVWRAYPLSSGAHQFTLHSQPSCGDTPAVVINVTL